MDAGASPNRKLGLWVPALIVLFAAFPVGFALYHATYAPLGRDQGIFQYAAWAVRQGERPYVDFREINGPLPLLIHAVFQKLGGENSHVFRLLDLVVMSGAFASIGAALPREGGARARALWGAAGWTVLGGQYTAFGLWHSAQRENFYLAFLLYATAIAVVALRRTPSWLHAAAAALATLPLFGKPTTVLYLGWLVVALVVGAGKGQRRAALKFLAIGCALGSAPVVFLLAEGALSACAKIVLGEAPRMYLHIWKLSIGDLYTAWGNRGKLNVAILTLIAAVVFGLWRKLPVAYWTLFGPLVGGLLTYVAQGKGFTYHLHPAMAGAMTLWLAVAIELVERPTGPAKFAPVAALAFGALTAYRAIDNAVWSQGFRERFANSYVPPGAPGHDDFVAKSDTGDFFGRDLEAAAAFLRANVAEKERIQVYGMDPYLLFLARRKSATPYIYSLDFDEDAPLGGASGGKPSAADADRIRAIVRRNREGFGRAFREARPRAFATIDLAPFSYPSDGFQDFRKRCPEAAREVDAHYVQAGRFGAVRVWLRSDGLP